MDAYLDTTLGRVVLVIAAAGLLFFLLAVVYLLRANRAPYWRARRAAGQRGGQLFLFAVTLFGLAAGLAFFGGLGSLALDGALEDGTTAANAPPRIVTATPGPTINVQATIGTEVAARVGATLTALPTATARIITTTPSPSPVPPTATPTPVPPTATATPDPFAAFTGLLDDSQPVNVPSPGPDASLDITALATGIRLDAQPDDPGTRFDAGFTRLYVFFEHTAMDSGTTWAYRLYLDETPVAGAVATWEDDADGSAFVFLDVRVGFPPGSYTLRLFTGEREADRESFRVVAVDA